MTEQTVDGVVASRPISYIRVAVLSVLLLVGAVATLVGMFFGAVAGLAVFSVLQIGRAHV